MAFLLPTKLELVLLTGYVLFSMLLNIIAYLIAIFYQRKFNQPSPQTGFIIAILLMILFIISLFTKNQGIQALQLLSVLFLLGSGTVSAISILSLFFTMRKVQK